MNTAALEDLLSNKISQNSTPSLQYIFFDAKSPLYEFRKGFADISNQAAITEKSISPIFSVTKTFTALAILQLEERGLININDEASRYLSDFPYHNQITIKQLLSHTSGISNPIPLNWVHLAQEHEIFDRHTFFKGVFDQNKKILFRPGTKFRYSNLGFILLGLLIEHVSKMPYEQFIMENIFNKLSLPEGEMTFTLSGGDAHVKGYQKRMSFMNLLLPLFMNTKKYMGDAEGAWKPFRDFKVNGAAYGGINASARALMSYLQQLLQDNSVLLGNDFKKKLFQENLLFGKIPSGMCLSWFKGNLKDLLYFSHAGGGGGFYCEARLYPSRQTGSLIMFNRTGVTDERFLDTIDRLML